MSSTISNLADELRALRKADARKTKKTGKSLSHAEEQAVKQKVWAKQEKKNTRGAK